MKSHRQVSPDDALELIARGVEMLLGGAKAIARAGGYPEERALRLVIERAHAISKERRGKEARVVALDIAKPEPPHNMEENLRRRGEGDRAGG